VTGYQKNVLKLYCNYMTSRWSVKTLGFE